MDAMTVPETSSCYRPCTYEYMPICGLSIDGCGEPMTFSNRCDMQNYNECDAKHGGKNFLMLPLKRSLHLR